MLEALCSAASPHKSEELALRLIERVIAALAAGRRSPAAPTGREARRVVEAIRFIESNAARPVQLQDLAAIAGMSKYHFLRVFRRLTGVTPHQYLITARMRRAALGLASSRRSVLDVALDAGFGDLSTFNKRFRATFGLTPTQYRACACRRGRGPGPCAARPRKRRVAPGALDRASGRTPVFRRAIDRGSIFG